MSYISPYYGVVYLISSSFFVFFGSNFLSEKEEIYSGFSLLSLMLPAIMIFFIVKEKNKGTINNSNVWFFVAGTAFVLTAFLSKYVWVDLFWPELLRVDDPLAVQDANKYDLSGYMLLQYGHGLGHWQSFAIDRYVYLIYYIFGVDTVNVALVNCLLRFLSVLVVLKIIYECAGDIKNRDYVSLLFFLPLGLYYSLMPSKEVITILFFNIFVLYVIRCTKCFTFKNIVLLSVSLFFISLIRLNLGLFCLCALSFILIFFLKKPSHKFGLVIIFFIAIVPFDFIARTTMNLSLLDIVSRYDGIMELSDRLDSTNASGISGKIKELSVSYGVFGYLIMLPLKLLVVYFSPYPLISFDIFSAYDMAGSKGKDVVFLFYDFFATLSALVNVLFFGYIFNSFNYGVKVGNYSTKVFSILVLFVVAIISFVYLSGFTRLRTLFEMLLFSMIFISGVKYKHAALMSFLLLSVAIFLNLFIILY
ncbi:hypothetical protein N6393_004047 [Vibrio vulnificus]|nr:hypothetical protein [Vibrio vulnificus]